MLLSKAVIFWRLSWCRILAILVAILYAFLDKTPFQRHKHGLLVLIFTALFFASSYLIAKNTSGRTTASVVVVGFQFM